MNTDINDLIGELDSKLADIEKALKKTKKLD